MTLYTGRGDGGETGLVGGSRLSKASARIEACGTVDEAAASIAFARAAVSDDLLGRMLIFVQHRLANCASVLATPEADSTDAQPHVSAADVSWLEQAVDHLTEKTGEFRQFVIASDGETSSRLNVARTVVRRAERKTVALAEKEPVDGNVLAFMNRLSDLLYAASAYVDAEEYRPQQVWNPQAESPEL